MVYILIARENGIFVKQCCGWFDVNGKYRFESVSFLWISIRIFIPVLFIVISKKGSLVWIYVIVNWILLLAWFGIESKWSDFTKLTFCDFWHMSKDLKQEFSKYLLTKA